MENNTVFVLLAGGKSERMGVTKGLLEYNQTFWILEQIHRISTAQLSEVYIGLGFNYQHYLTAIPWFVEAQTHFVNYQGIKVRVIINENPEMGSFSTLQTVLKKIPSNQSVLINPIDIPILDLTGLNTIIGTQNNIVLPNFEGKNGHPIKLSAAFWSPLTLLNPADKNARLDVEIKKVDPSEIAIIELNDSSIVKNLNTKKDWIEYLKYSAKHPAQ